MEGSAPGEWAGSARSWSESSLVNGLEFRVWGVVVGGLEFRDWGLGVWGLEFRDWGVGVGG